MNDIQLLGTKDSAHSQGGPAYCPMGLTLTMTYLMFTVSHREGIFIIIPLYTCTNQSNWGEVNAINKPRLFLNFKILKNFLQL
jgi:hypothetical protein